MKKRILLLLFVLVVFAITFLFGLSYVEESIRENSENDKPCENYQMLNWTSLFSKESQFLLGKLYSRGTCFEQDISRAKDLYASVYSDDSEKIARALFHDAIQLADFYERTQKDVKPEYVHALLVESRNLGFKPSDRESKDLNERGLAETFAEPASKH